MFEHSKAEDGKVIETTYFMEKALNLTFTEKEVEQDVEVTLLYNNFNNEDDNNELIGFRVDGKRTDFTDDENEDRGEVIFDELNICLGADSPISDEDMNSAVDYILEVIEEMGM